MIRSLVKGRIWLYSIFTSVLIAIGPGFLHADEPADTLEDSRKLLLQVQKNLDSLKDQLTPSSPPSGSPVTQKFSQGTFLGEIRELVAPKTEPEFLPSASRSTWEVSFRLVPAGFFKMGANEDQRSESKMGDNSSSIDWSVPDHWVVVKESYFMARTEISRAQYLAYYLDQTPNFPNSLEKLPRALKPLFQVVDQKLTMVNARLSEPVTNVTWTESMDYCRWLSGRLKLVVSLPTEVEWEYAARGMRSEPTPWLKPEAFASSPEHRQVHEVGKVFEDQSWCGILDLGGNVSEWCLDDFKEDAIKEQSERLKPKNYLEYLPSEARGRESKEGRKTIRGGKFGDSEFQSRSFNRRYKSFSSNEYDFIGFRPVILLREPAPRPINQPDPSEKKPKKSDVKQSKTNKPGSRQ